MAQVVFCKAGNCRFDSVWVSKLAELLTLITQPTVIKYATQNRYHNRLHLTTNILEALRLIFATILKTWRHFFQVPAP